MLAERADGDGDARVVEHAHVHVTERGAAVSVGPGRRHVLERGVVLGSECPGGIG